MMRANQIAKLKQQIPTFLNLIGFHCLGGPGFSKRTVNIY